LSISVIGLNLLPTYCSYEWEGAVEEDSECLMVSESILYKAENMYSNTLKYIVLMYRQRIHKTCPALLLVSFEDELCNCYRSGIACGKHCCCMV